MPTFTLAEIAALTGGRVAGDAARRVDGAAPPGLAGPGDLTFVFGPTSIGELTESRAGAAIVPDGCEMTGRDVVVHRNPQVAMAMVLEAFHPEERPAPGVHPTALVDPSVKIGAGVHVAAHAVIERDVVLGEGALVGAGSYIGARCVLGEGSRLHPRVVLYSDVTLGRRCVVHSCVVLGADGFGYVRSGGKHVKIPQVSGVVVGDDVEIGANSCIDRGTMTPTRIGNGVKIDNQVQVGHNCTIGDRVVLCGQVGLAGSTTIEEDAVLGGQVGISGHLTVGRGAMIGAKSGVIADVPAGARLAGFPAEPIEDWRRTSAITRHLPDLRRELKRLAQRLDELERGRS